MARVYSTRFLFGESQTGVDVSYTVPAGFVAIVRDINVVQVGAGAGNLTEFVIVPPSGDGITFVYLQTPDDNSSIHFECRVVVVAGEILVGASEGPAICHVTCSGYLLGLP